MSTSNGAKTTLEKIFDEIERRIEKLEKIVRKTGEKRGAKKNEV